MDKLNTIDLSVFRVKERILTVVKFKVDTSPSPLHELGENKLHMYITNSKCYFYARGLVTATFEKFQVKGYCNYDLTEIALN